MDILIILRLDNLKVKNYHLINRNLFTGHPIQNGNQVVLHPTWTCIFPPSEITNIWSKHIQLEWINLVFYDSQSIQSCASWDQVLHLQLIPQRFGITGLELLYSVHNLYV